VVAHSEIWLVSDHPVCGAKVGFAEILLISQPPLLTRRGMFPAQTAGPIHSHLLKAGAHGRATLRRSFLGGLGFVQGPVRPGFLDEIAMPAFLHHLSAI
jgi:hypothetical protein